MTAFNPLKNFFFLDRTKLKALADDNLNDIEMLVFVFDIVENIVDIGENAGYQHFLLLPRCFQKLPYSG